MGRESWILSRRRDPVVLDRRVALGVQASGCASRDLVDSAFLDRVSHQIAIFDVLRSRPVPVAALPSVRPPWDAAVHRMCDLGSADRIRDFRFDTFESVRRLGVRLRPAHVRWARALHPEVAPVIAHIRMPLVDHPLRWSGFPNLCLPAQVSQGRPIVGTPAPGGAFVLRDRPSKLSIDELMSGVGPPVNSSVFESCSSTGYFLRMGRVEGESFRSFLAHASRRSSPEVRRVGSSDSPCAVRPTARGRRSASSFQAEFVSGG